VTELSKKLDEIFRAVLDLPASREVRSVARGSEERWDSLAHTLMVAAVESEFGIEIDVADSLSLGSYSEVESYLRNRLGPA